MSTTFDAILIDDDPLVQMTWEFAAKQAQKNVMVFRTIAEFEAALSTLDLSTPIYLDSSLGPGIRGEIYARELHAKGFSEIYLATGYSPDQFPAMPWIREVVGKSPPF